MHAEQMWHVNAASSHSIIQFGLGSVHISTIYPSYYSQTVTKTLHAAVVCCVCVCVCVCVDKKQIASRLSCVMLVGDGANGCTGRDGGSQGECTMTCWY